MILKLLVCTLPALFTVSVFLAEKKETFFDVFVASFTRVIPRLTMLFLGLVFLLIVSTALKIYELRQS